MLPLNPCEQGEGCTHWSVQQDGEITFLKCRHCGGYVIVDPASREKLRQRAGGGV